MFGPRYAEVTFTDSDLRGSVFYIVAGHGGPDPGATGKRGNHTLCEDEYAYDIALRLTRNLLAHGAIAYVITRDPNDGIRDEAYLKCDTDEYCWKAQAIPRGQLSRLHQRAEAINRLYWRHKGAKQRVVVLHVDSRSRGNRVDMFFYYHSTSHSGKRLAETLHQTIRRKYQIHQPARGYHGFVRARDELYMLRKPLPTTVYVELGNIKNSFDQLRLIKVDNRQAVANWLTEGLIKDINATK
ncbi:MAG: N-acetylmuramoyl-L-alanine amidase [Gemmatimonadetes bacterium]|nr:MAG: N-acetylmuramoyl-L-alanine amidase [Gemmatimonadota bacterium]